MSQEGCEIGRILALGSEKCGGFKSTEGVQGMRIEGGLSQEVNGLHLYTRAQSRSEVSADRLAG
jgi:hypothetical protein